MTGAKALSLQVARKDRDGHSAPFTPTAEHHTPASVLHTPSGTCAEDGRLQKQDKGPFPREHSAAQGQFKESPHNQLLFMFK
jgi:hypothetical protein